MALVNLHRLKKPPVTGLAMALLLGVTGCSLDNGFEAGSKLGARSRPWKPGDPNRPEVFDFVKECGISQEKMDDENAVIFEQSFTSLPINIKGSQMGVAFDVTTQAKLKISSTTKQASQTVSVSVVSAKAKPPSSGGFMGLIIGAVAPGIVKGKANEGANRASGTVSASAMPMKDWLHLVDGSNPQFEGLLCAGQGGQKSSRNSGGAGTVNFSFSPALVSSVSPLAPIERLRKEIGDGRSFSVTATVQGGGAEYAKGSVSGRTSVHEVTPTFNCQGTTLNADIAYEFINEFPGGAYKVGLPKRQVMYIDTQNKRFVAIINEDDRVDPQMKTTLPPVCLVSDPQ